MLGLQDIGCALGGATGLLIVSYLLGTGLQVLGRKLLKDAPVQQLNIFWRLLCGTILLLSLYAIICTKGLTVFLLAPVLLVLFVRQKVRHLGPEDAFPFGQQLIFFLLSVVLNFSFYLWAINSFSPDSVHYVSGDFNIYYRIAQRLNEFGIESLNLDPIYPAKYASPYHYGDLWLYALVTRFVGINPSLVFLVSFTHISIIFINGIYTYAYKRFFHYAKGVNGFLYLLLTAGFFTGFSMFFPRFIVPSAEAYTLSVMNWSKVLVPSSFLVALLILAKDKEWKALCLLVVIGSLSFINAMPALFMTVFFLLTINLFRKKITGRQWLKYHALYVLTTVVLVLLLYKILPIMMGVSAEEATGVEMQKSLDVKQYLLTAVKIFIGGWFQVFVLLPFVLLLLAGLVYSGSIKRLKAIILGVDNDILFLFFAICSGLTCWAILHPFAPDAVQFYTNILAPVYTIAISFLVLYILYVFRSKVLSGITVVVLAAAIYLHCTGVFFIQKDTRSEWNAIETFFKDKKEAYFANLRPVGHFRSFFDKNTVYFMPLGQLVYLWPHYHSFSLNAPFLSENPASPYANEEKIELDLAPFSIYYKEKKEQEPAATPEELMQSFIEDQKIGYITVSRDTVLPGFFRQHVKDSLVLNNANLIVYQIR